MSKIFTPWAGVQIAQVGDPLDDTSSIITKKDEPQADPIKIAVAFAGTTDWYSRFIQRLLKQPINHALLVYKDPVWGGLFAAEVDGEGLRVLPFEIARKRFDLLELWRCNVDLSVGMSAVRFMIGSRYDFLGMIAGVFRILWWRLTGRRTTYKLHSKDRLFCSEFVTHVLQQASVPRADVLDPPNTSPGALRAWLRTNPAFEAIQLEDLL